MGIDGAPSSVSCRLRDGMATAPKTEEDTSDNVTAEAHNLCRSRNKAASSTSDGNGVERKRTSWWEQSSVNICMLVMLCLLVYGNSLHGDFVFDDDRAILENPIVNTDFSPVAGMPVVSGNSEYAAISAVWSYDFWGLRRLDHPQSHKSFRPLTTLSFRLNYSLAGKDDTMPWHLANVLLHASCCVALYAVSWRLYDGDATAALVSAALFASQSVHVEAVSNVVSRCEILAALLLLLTVYSVQRCLSSTHAVWIFVNALLGITAGVGSLLSKEQGISALAIAAAYVVFTNLECSLLRKSNTRKTNLSQFTLASLFAVFTTAFAVSAWWRWSASGAPCESCFPREINPASFHESAQTRMLTMAYVWSINLWLMLCPIWLCCDWGSHSIPLVHSWLDTRLLLPMVTFYLTMLPILHYLASLWKAIARRQRQFSDTYNGLEALKSLHPIGIAMSTMLLTFLPASGLLVRVGFVVAERTLYMPSIGLCMLFGYGFSLVKGTLIHSSSRRRVFWTCTVLVISFQSIQTIMRNSAWRDSTSLFTTGVAINPTNARLHTFAGRSLVDTDLHRAEGHFRKSLEYGRDAGLDEQSYNDLGRALALQGRYAEALEEFKEAVRIKPGYSDAVNNIGYCKRRLKLQGLDDSGFTNYEEEVELGNAFARSQSYEMAMKHYERALANRLQTDPAPGAAMNNLAMVYKKLNRHNDAEVTLRESIKVDPSFGGNIPNLARLLRDMGRSEEADTLESKGHESLHIEEEISLGDQNYTEGELISSLQKDSSNSQHWYLLGMSLKDGATNSNRQLDAEQCFRMALNKDPTNRLARQQLEAIVAP